MPAIDNPDIIYMIIGATMCFFLLIVIVMVARTNSLLKKSLGVSINHNKSLTGTIEMLVQRTEEFNKEYKQLQTDLALNELYDGASDVYFQAIQAANAGATAHEIAEEHGVIHSEAELIVAVHGARKRVAV